MLPCGKTTAEKQQNDGKCKLPPPSCNNSNNNNYNNKINNNNNNNCKTTELQQQQQRQFHHCWKSQHQAQLHCNANSSINCGGTVWWTLTNMRKIHKQFWYTNPLFAHDRLSLENAFNGAWLDRLNMRHALRPLVYCALLSSDITSFGKFNNPPKLMEVRSLLTDVFSSICWLLLLAITGQSRSIWSGVSAVRSQNSDTLIDSAMYTTLQTTLVRGR